VSPKVLFQSGLRRGVRATMAAAPRLELGLMPLQQLRHPVQAAGADAPLLLQGVLHVLEAGDPASPHGHFHTSPRFGTDACAPPWSWVPPQQGLKPAGNVRCPPPLSWALAVTQHRRRGPQAAHGVRLEPPSPLDPIGHGLASEWFLQRQQGRDTLGDAGLIVGPHDVLGCWRERATFECLPGHSTITTFMQ
jgi:hypothetical protein